MSADNRMAKAIDTAVKIAQRVADTLAPIQHEMDIMHWPPEFRVILWDAIGVEAARRAAKCAERASAK